MRYLFIIVMLLISYGDIFAQPHHVDVSVNFSFNELDEYGEWVSVSGYGRVWRPYVGPKWRPFMYGQWVWSDDGWLWESYEPYGWMVCHYGNWYYDDEWEWVWIPGYEWSPARVEWHVTEHEIGWVPLLPSPLPGRRKHVHVDWHFCSINNFASVEIHNHVVVRPRATTVVVRRGPPRIDVVRRKSTVKVIRVTPKKVTVRSNKRRFVRVEPSRRHTHKVVVPIGPKYRTRVKKRSRSGSITVESTSRPRKRSVTVSKESHSHHKQYQRGTPQRKHTVEVNSSHRQKGVSKVKVQTGDGHQKKKKSGKVRAKVKVRKK